MTRNQQIFNRAVDMFMEDKNIYLQYKGFDESMEPERTAESPDLYYRGLDTKIDDYWPDRSEEAAQALYFQYHKIPEYQGMTYVPPPFREKYEICIWKVETKGLIKIK